jgi:hypothetical protein
MNSYALAANAVLLAHAAFVLFVVGGQFLIVLACIKHWRWGRCLWLRLLHLLAISYVVIQTWLGFDCPLTVWEQDLRRLAGLTVQSQDFIVYWVEYLLFYQGPAWLFSALYTVFGGLVLLTFWRCPPDWQKLARVVKKQHLHKP